MTSTPVESDRAASADLLTEAQSGDAEAFGELCRYHEGRLLRQAMSLCGERALAEDLTQDTLVEAWKSLRRYNGRCRFFTWLCAILLNRFRNVRREKRPIPFSALDAADDESTRYFVDGLIDSASVPDMAAQRSERDRMLRQAIAKLPDKHREVIHLRFFVDDSLEGIAVALNCSIGTVKSRLFHALEKLRRVNKQYATDAELKERRKS